MGRSRFWRATRFAAAMATVGMIACGPAAAQLKCDAALHPVGGGDGYQRRGDRCEGVYARAVALGEVHLVGVGWRQSAVTATPGSHSLRLVWAVAPMVQQVHVRAWALRPQLYYRMDSIRPAGASGYDWPNELLQRLNLATTDLGVLAWSSITFGGVAHDVFLPVGFGDATSAAQPIELTLLSDVQLKEIYLTIFPVSTDGKIGSPLYKDMPVKRGFYPANRGIGVALPALAGPGFYRIDIGSTFLDGGAGALSQFIYLAKPAG